MMWGHLAAKPLVVLRFVLAPALALLVRAPVGQDVAERVAGRCRRHRPYPRRQSSLSRCDPAIGPIASMPPSTTQEAPLT
jgi:hypothetical protein